MAHNIWYTSLGTAQFTVWEAIFLNMYATGKLSYVSNAELFANPADMAMTVLWIFAIPLWRGLHFYFSHRLLHVRVLYKYVHSLHHRNTDIEPFAGMAMASSRFRAPCRGAPVLTACAAPSLATAPARAACTSLAAPPVPTTGAG